MTTSRPTEFMCVAIYLIAIVVANLAIFWFGPAATIVVALILIGLDLTIRDALHDMWKGRDLVWKMGGLILGGSVLTLAMNIEAAKIGFASFAAFAVAGTLDTIVYHLLGDKVRIIRVNGSNVVAAAADSIIFPTLAFGAFMPLIILGQFAAKVAGGALWSVVLMRKDQDVVST